MNTHKMKTIFIKEIKELKRDKISRIMVFLLPVVILLVFGYGMALDVEKIPFSILDEDNTFTSREISYKFINNYRYYTFKGYVKKQSEGIELIDRNRIRMLLVIPNGFEKDLKNGRGSSIQIIEDGVFPYRASISKTYSNIIINKFNIEKFENKNIKELFIDLRIRYWFNEEMRQKNVTASGVLLVVLFISPAIFASLLIVKEKELGSIYNIWTSSISKKEFLLAKQSVAVMISFLNYFILFAMIIVLFKTPFKGSFILFTISSFIYILVSTSLGILISTFVKTQVSAVVATSIICIIPSILYSGYLTPISSMTNEAFIVAHLFPNYYYFNIIKMSFLKGFNLNIFIKNIIILIFFYLFFISISIARFRKYQC
ncbi:ABC transporter permease [Calditerrivibrio sp.]|uniref:ABC transporter permease n=1 Tax=Calditerrivibrio sp. TaxID=2792612 RepID=UPI003D0B2B6C